MSATRAPRARCRYEGMGRPHHRSSPRRGVRPPRQARPRARAGTRPRPRRVLRCLPHRPARGRGRPRRRTGPDVTPGHEVVGVVDATGPGAERFADRRAGRRGLAGQHRRHLPVLPDAGGRTSAWRRPSPAGTVDGGYADYCLADEAFAYRLPDGLDDEQAAPLLCAGIIGYRALRVRRGAARRPARLVRLRRQRPPDRAARAARGAASARAHPRRAQPAAGPRARRRLGRRQRRTPRPSRWTARSCSRRPATIVPPALAALERGGTLAVAGIWLAGVPALDYDRHLFQERHAAQRHGQHPRRRRGVPRRWPQRFGVRATTTPYPMAEAAQALDDLAHGRFSGAAVLHN